MKPHDLCHPMHFPVVFGTSSIALCSAILNATHLCQHVHAAALLALHGDAENAGLEKAGLELNGPSRKTGKCKTGIKRTKSQDWKMQDWN